MKSFIFEVKKTFKELQNSNANKKQHYNKEPKSIKMFSNLKINYLPF